MNFQVKVRPKKIDNAVQAFALERHGEQSHGSLKICDHLADVARNVAAHYDPHVNILDPEDIIAAAWLHDIIEDTTTTLEEVEERFGASVGNLVNLLTDKDGYNRLERHLRTYHAIRSDPDATLIKLCDRRHNQDRSLSHGEHWMVMYEREYNYFKFALWTPHKFQKLWSELDWQNKEMKKKLTW
jgi:guanosine-3',5'-bis(diphosphate) 3'-pyrophosphohydrolase